MRVMVTGAGGFIGSHLVASLADQHEVYAMVRRTPDLPVAGVQYIEHDLAHPLDESRLPATLDAIIHQAALIDTDALQYGDAAAFEVNVIGTWRMLEYARRIAVARFVHASTGGVYGHADHPMLETDPPNPMDLYAITKAQAELVVHHTPTPFPKIVLRYFLPYGAGTPNPLPRFIGAVLAGDEVTIAADRGPAMNPIHITDAVAATVAALELDSDAVINIAGTEITNYAEIAEFAGARVGRPVAMNIVGRMELIAYYRGDLVGSTQRMHELLGFTPRVTLDRGLAELVDDIEKGSSHG